MSDTAQITQQAEIPSTTQPNQQTDLPSATQPTQQNELDALFQKLSSSQLPQDLAEKAHTMVERAQLTLKYGGYFTHLDQVAAYIDWVCALPWKKRSTDNLDIAHAKDVFDQHHHGLSEIKERILEYMSVMKLNILQAEKDPTNSLSFTRAPILFFVGLVGT